MQNCTDYLASKGIGSIHTVRGSLEVGKVADMVILSDNPYTVDIDKIADIEVEELLLAGKPYESAVTPLGKCIWNGLFSKNRY